MADFRIRTFGSPNQCGVSEVQGIVSEVQQQVPVRLRSGSAFDSIWRKKRAKLRSEFVTLSNFGDFLAHKAFVSSVEFCQETKKSQALRMTAHF
jgi:hypothetical protein